jgi:hypothetical protein
VRPYSPARGGDVPERDPRVHRERELRARAELRAESVTGKPLQVELLTSMLKAPGTKPLKLKCDELLSSFAFKFKLRRYTQVPDLSEPVVLAKLGCAAGRAFHFSTFHLDLSRFYH